MRVQYRKEDEITKGVTKTQNMRCRKTTTQPDIAWIIHGVMLGHLITPVGMGNIMNIYILRGCGE